ncbi:hypothetical protein [Streptomyces violascens]|uniref:Uncharacterized protein n=1 Tax=Streptomyces violascens TaxID=67381 RepID=A0ABQ3QXD3_9ACTN|nr:hypothetical protein [Streptomyces violascens]GGU13282.1 hypothetical protein GCM10010289_38700 [Streptomyces violascens]GHI41920.1 hypothetical protein Sviol_63280 [Streptomyces violascens]
MSMYRLDPLHAVEAYQTYSITVPPDVLVKAACEQVGCEAWRNGWESVINEATDLGRAQAEYIRTRAGRTFREQRTGGGFTVFRFEAGQRCFAEHQTRPELYAVRDGDWRGNPTGRARQHTRAADWVEDFGEHQQRIADQTEKG